MIAVAIADRIAARPAEGKRRAPRQARRSRAPSTWTTPRPRRSSTQSTPVYYITGTIHSPETGAPTALMELAYRLAVDDSPYIKYIRSHMITLITPVVEVDGRDRMVDIYNWHRAHPDQNYPHLIYWGHYVAHDNNRDAMAMTLDLTRNVLNTYLGWHAQVLHDLHESVPFLYDNTVGDGPYNAWIDPILTNEWQMLGWNNVQADDQARHARRLHPRRLRHLEPGLPDVPRRHAQRHQPPLRNLRQRRRRHREAHPRRRTNTRAPGTGPTRRCPWSSGRSATTTTTKRPRCSRPSLLRAERQALPQQLLPEEQALHQKPTHDGPAAYVLSADDPSTPAARPSCSASAAPARRDQRHRPSLSNCRSR